MKFELQRADFWKRISAFLFDIVMLGVLICAVAIALSAILNYDQYADVAEKVEAEYAAEYGIDPNLSRDEYNALTPEQREPYDACDAARVKDERLQMAYYMMEKLRYAIVIGSIFVGFLVLEFAVPLLFKNGQTLGKKAFGLAVIHTNGVRLHGQAHFIRSIIGKCAIETLVPAFVILLILSNTLGIVGTAVLILLLILEIYAVASTRTRSTIHDLISDTVVVDMASQMIFDTPDEMMDSRRGYMLKRQTKRNIKEKIFF